MVDHKEIGQRVKQRRKWNGMTLKNLADKAGVSVSFLVTLERGGSGTRIDTLDLVADALGVKLEWLVYGGKR